MINRREVMASGAAMLLARGALAAASPGGHAADGPARFVFVADERAPAARAAARAATDASWRPTNDRGTVYRPFASDITPIYDWLDLHLRATPASVAGVTTARSLFPIERLAWDRGLRTIYRGLHRDVAGPAPTHELLGSPAIVERIDGVESGDWAEIVGRVLAEAAPGPGDFRHIVTSQQVPDNDDSALISWLLAPREMLRP
jgi:hypothetical protein